MKKPAELCEAICKLDALANQFDLELDIGVPSPLFHDVIDMLGLEKRPDRQAYGRGLPCAYLNHTKLTVSFQPPQFRRIIP